MASRGHGAGHGHQRCQQYCPEPGASKQRRTDGMKRGYCDSDESDVLLRGDARASASARARWPVDRSTGDAQGDRGGWRHGVGIHVWVEICQLDRRNGDVTRCARHHHVLEHLSASYPLAGRFHALGDIGRIDLEVCGEAPVPPSCPLIRTPSARALETPAAIVPTPTSATSLTLTSASGLALCKSKINCWRSSIEYIS